MRAFVGQFLRQRQNVVVFFRLHQLAEVIHPRGRVHLLGNDQGLWLQIQRDRGVGAGGCAYWLHVALRGFDARHCIHYGFQMLGSRAATAANNAYTVILHEVFVKVGQVFGRELVDRVAADVLRQARIRQNRDVFGGVQAQVSDCLIHLRRPGRAVQTDHVNVVRFKRRERRANLGPEQHGAGFLQRDLHLNGQALSRFAHCLQHRDRRDLRLQQVLTRFDEQHIDPAFDQRQRLLFVGRQHRVPTDVSERGQFCCRTHRSRHEPRFVPGRKLLRHFSGELRRLQVDLTNLVAQIELA